MEEKGFFMLNYIWAVMIAIGVIYGALTGNIEAVANGALDSAGEAVQLCITMTGIMALWVGLMEIAKNSGLIASMTKGIQPFISFLFPRIPGNHAAREYISTNIIANILGLGWACTPAGLKAMEELQKLNEEECRRTGKPPVTASNEMCTFLIMNISSAADTGIHYCVPQPVRERKSDGGYCAGYYCYTDLHIGCNNLCESDGSKAENLMFRYDGSSVGYCKSPMSGSPQGMGYV